MDESCTGDRPSATTHLEVGTLVFANDCKHPAVLAKEVATLVVLSRGRVVDAEGRLVATASGTFAVIS